MFIAILQFSSVPPLVRTLRGALRAYRLNEQLQALNASHLHSPSSLDILSCNCTPRFAVDANHPLDAAFQAQRGDSAFGEHFLGTDSWLPFARTQSQAHQKNTDGREWQCNRDCH